MKKSILLMLAVSTAIFSVQAQSKVWGPVGPKVTYTTKSVTRSETQRFGTRAIVSDTTVADTAKSAIIFRQDFYGGYAYSFNGFSHLVAGTGFSAGDFEWKNGRWVPTWSAGIYALANSTVAPVKFNDVVGVGLVGSYKGFSGGVALMLSGQTEILAGYKLPIFSPN